MSSNGNEFDPILIEVMRHEIISVSEEMNITMKQTTRSICAKEGGDYSAGIVDSNGNVMGQAVPFGLNYFTAVMPHIMKKFANRFEPGDVLISNDPYGGLSHLPDIAVVKPIFWRDQHCGFAVVVQHHTDIGGRFPGGMGLQCGEVYEEGLRLPGVKLYSNGEPNEALLDIIAANVRTPDDVLGDLEAGVAACRRGERGLIALMDKYGRKQVERCTRQLQRNSEQAMREAIRSIPDGSYRCEEVFDDGCGTRVKLVVTLVVKGDSVTVDFTGTGPQVKNALNVPPDLTRNILCTSVFLGLLGKEIALNAGLFAPISIIAPEGTVVNPRFPAAVGSRGQLLLRVLDMVCAALAQAVPDRIPAAGEGGPSMMVYSSDQSYSQTTTSDARSAMIMDLYCSCWGGRSTADGVEGVFLFIQPGFRSNSGEVLELELPLMLEGFGFVPDTGGPGRFRGGLSVYRRWRYLADGRVMLRTCRIDSLPYGLAGGRPGTPFRATLISGTQETPLPPNIMLEVPVRAGDVIEHVQPGAGGYGDPLTRDPALVLADLLDEKITRQYAEREYGVVANERRGVVDQAATTTLRKSRVQQLATS